jgi:hypothetical protein
MWVKGFVAFVVILAFLSESLAGQDSRNGKELKAREIFITPVHEPSTNVPANRPPAATPQVSSGGLALRYALLQGIPNSCPDLRSYSGVDPDSSFRTGDCVRVFFEVNTPGYFYVLTRGSSGQFTALPVSAGSGAIESKIDPCQTYEFPADTGIRFKDPAGEERLYLVLSREPVSAFKSGDQTAISQALGLSADLSAAVNAQPGLRSRDIVIEKVTSVKSPQSAKALEPVQAAPRECGSLTSQSLIYVATDRPDLRQVVADIRLIHK